MKADTSIVVRDDTFLNNYRSFYYQESQDSGGSVEVEVRRSFFLLQHIGQATYLIATQKEIRGNEATTLPIHERSASGVREKGCVVMNAMPTTRKGLPPQGGVNTKSREYRACQPASDFNVIRGALHTFLRFPFRHSSSSVWVNCVRDTPSPFLIRGSSLMLQEIPLDS